jgi:DnaJ-class molecular chaperone
VSRKALPRAFCTFCKQVRAQHAEDPKYGIQRHGPKASRCPGRPHAIHACPTCNGVRTVRQWADDHVCDTCKGAGRIVR